MSAMPAVLRHGSAASFCPWSAARCAEEGGASAACSPTGECQEQRQLIACMLRFPDTRQTCMCHLSGALLVLSYTHVPGCAQYHYVWEAPGMDNPKLERPPVQCADVCPGLGSAGSAPPGEAALSRMFSDRQLPLDAEVAQHCTAVATASQQLGMAWQGRFMTDSCGKIWLARRHILTCSRRFDTVVID